MKESTEPLVSLTCMRNSSLASKTCKQSKMPIVFHKYKFKRVCCFMTIKKWLLFTIRFPYRGYLESQDPSLSKLRQAKITSLRLNLMLKHKKEGSYLWKQLQVKATARAEQEWFLKGCLCGTCCLVLLSRNGVHICRAATGRSPGESRVEWEGSEGPKLSSHLRYP